MSRFLLILTSHGSLGNSGTATGFWLEELAAPMGVLLAHGIDFDVVSIVGGRPPVDPTSTTPDFAPSELDRAALDAVIDATASIGDVDPALYDAVLLVGGHGTMWDFPGNAALAAVVSDVAEHGVVASVCHGAAGLVDAVGSDGTPLVAGRTITAFSDAEEDAVGATAVVPFSLEQRLADLGAVVECAPPFSSHVRRDGNLVTGQNPQSSRAVAELAVEVVRDLQSVGAPSSVRSPLDTWRNYASLWSMASEERDSAATVWLHPDVAYRDADVDVSGTVALGEFMDRFRTGLPGHRFRIDDVTAHHGMSLARWTHVDTGGKAVGSGTSHAVHSDDGRLHAISGFFHK